MKSSLLLSALALLGAAKLSAISYDANIHGTSAPSGVTFTAFGGDGTVGLKYQDGTANLGVAGGTAGNEIGPREKLKISFDTPQHLTSLTIGLLFDGPEYNDVFEIAAALTDASAHVFTLKALGTTTAVWDGWKPATNLKPAVNGKGGVWQVTNPFGSLLVSAIWLYPIDSAEYNAYTGKKNHSDFGLVAFSTPDTASTLALAIGALLGVGVLARRNRK